MKKSSCVENEFTLACAENLSDLETGGSNFSNRDLSRQGVVLTRDGWKMESETAQVAAERLLCRHSG